MITKTIFAGFGGQGVLMMGYVFAVAAMRDGLHVTYLPSYGAEVRGGTANCTVVVSDEEIASPVASSPDFAVVMNNPSLIKYQGMMKSGSIMFLNSNLIDSSPTRDDIEVVGIPADLPVQGDGHEQGDMHPGFLPRRKAAYHSNSGMALYCLPFSMGRNSKDLPSSSRSNSSIRVS